MYCLEKTIVILQYIIEHLYQGRVALTHVFESKSPRLWVERLREHADLSLDTESSPLINNLFDSKESKTLRSA